jgi:hypothetical protein
MNRSFAQGRWFPKIFDVEPDNRVKPSVAPSSPNS